MKLPLRKIIKSQAFGLVETLIAVAVLSLVLLVSVTLGSMVLRSMTLRAQTVQATNLARQKLEEVRNIRDNTWLGSRGSGMAWDYWVGTGPTATQIAESSANSYYIIKQDTNQLSYLSSVSAGNGEENKLSFGDGSTISYFSKIKVSKANIGAVDGGSGASWNSNDITAPKKIYQVESEVSWESYGGTTSVVLRTYLSDWLPKF